MLYNDFLEELRGNIGKADAEVEVYDFVVEGGENFDLVAVHGGVNYGVDDPDVIVTAGFHGEEPAGPITIMNKVGDIIKYANQRGISISLFPCVNPSGFEDHRRYNRDGENPNNAFLEYEIRPGLWLGELPPGFTFRRTRKFKGMPKETASLYDRIYRKEPLAFLDIHQDDEFSGERTYAYVFGNRADYIPIINATTEWADIVADTVVDNGSYGHVRVATDANGLTEFNDGSIIDYFWRQGTDILATVETTTTTPMEDAISINMTWIRGIIDLAAEKKHGDS